MDKQTLVDSWSESAKKTADAAMAVANMQPSDGYKQECEVLQAIKSANNAHHIAVQCWLQYARTREAER